MLSQRVPPSSVVSSSFLACCFLIAAVFAQLRYDTVWQEHFVLHAPVHKFVLPAPIVNHLAFGFRDILADYYWVTAIQDFNKWDRKDVYYPEYFRIISTLDPKFEYPYIFATLTIPSRISPDESLKWLSVIAERGMAALPMNWEIPFYTGMEYHIIGKSYERAAHYIGIAANIPGSPEVTREVYGLYLMHSSTDYQRSRALFSAIYETSDNDSTKALAKERIALLDLIEAIDQASLSYKSVHHVFPNSVAELTSTRLIAIPPEIIKRYPIVIDPETGKAILE